MLTCLSTKILCGLKQVWVSIAPPPNGADLICFKATWDYSSIGKEAIYRWEEGCGSL